MVKFCDDDSTAVVPVEKVNVKGVRSGEVKEGDRCLVKWYQKYYEAFFVLAGIVFNVTMLCIINEWINYVYKCMVCICMTRKQLRLI